MFSYFLIYALIDLLVFIFFFFFQAEDGIRDRDVTGVQTCALPILPRVTYLLSRPLLLVTRGIPEGLQKRLVDYAVSPAEIGRASCRERVESSGGAGSFRKKKNKQVVERMCE